MIWNYYYRDQDLQAEVALTNEAILRRAWEKDRYTVARPWQQRGTSPAIPVGGTAPLNFAAAVLGGDPYSASYAVLKNNGSDKIHTPGGVHNASLLLALNKGVADLSSAASAIS